MQSVMFFDFFDLGTTLRYTFSSSDLQCLPPGDPIPEFFGQTRVSDYWQIVIFIR